MSYFEVCVGYLGVVYLDIGWFEVLVIIFVYNEEDGFVVLFVWLYLVFDVFDMLYEVILINDGSCDCLVVMFVDQFYVWFDMMCVVLFNGNYGQYMVIFVGFVQLCGEIVIMFDVDLQNLFEEIGKLIVKMCEGYDYVGLICKQCQDSLWWCKVLQMMNWLCECIMCIKMIDQGCMLCVYSCCIIDMINVCGEVNMFIFVFVYMFVQNLIEIEVVYEECFVGELKYLLYSLIWLNFDFVMGFLVVLLQWLLFIGVILLFGFVVLFVLLFVCCFIVGVEV